MCGIHGIVAAVVKEVANIVCLEYFDEALVFRTIFIKASELVAGRTECATRHCLERGDSSGALAIGIDHVFRQRADNAVTPGINVCDFRSVLARGFDNTASGGIDNSGNAAGLGVESIHCRHVWWFQVQATSARA